MNVSAALKCYFVVAVALLGIVAFRLIRGKASLRQSTFHPAVFLLLIVCILMWPLMLLPICAIFIDFKFSIVDRCSSRLKRRAERRRWRVLLSKVKTSPHVSQETLQRLAETAHECVNGTFISCPGTSLSERLNGYWRDGKSAEVVFREEMERRARAEEERKRRERERRRNETEPEHTIVPGVRYQTVERLWTIGFTKPFLKSIESIDRKLQGRVLEAVGQIARDPCSVKGDTVKPLTGDQKGFWRYRLGDRRLIYKPDERGTVILVSLEPRGEAYR